MLQGLFSPKKVVPEKVTVVGNDKGKELEKKGKKDKEEEVEEKEEEEEEEEEYSAGYTPTREMTPVDGEKYEGPCVGCQAITTDQCSKCQVFVHDFCKHTWYL